MRVNVGIRAWNSLVFICHLILLDAKVGTHR